MHTVYYLILVPMVYVAVTVFFAGTATRLVSLFRKPKNPATLQIFPARNHRRLWALHDAFLLPTVRRHDPVLWGSLMVFHVSLLLLIVGHLELFGEFALFQVVPHEIFAGRGVIGLLLTVCLVYFLFRRFRSSVRDLSVPEDYYLLVLLLCTVLFGSEMDWARSWHDYGEMAVDDYREYLTSLIFFRPSLPDAVTGSGHSFMLVLHVFFANVFLMCLPFSKIMHSFFSLPVNVLRRG